jgi:hypothetical protein
MSATLGKETSTVRVRVKYNSSQTLRADLKLSEGVAIPGRIVASAVIAVKNLRVHLSEVDPALPEPALTEIAANGQFVVPGVQPGNYSVSVDGLTGDQYLKSVVSGGLDVLEQSLPVGTPAELQVQIGVDGGRVSGAVYDRNSALFPNAEVILVPTSVSRLRFDRYRTTASDDDGQFVIRGIAPGDYKVFAWTNLEANAHLNTEFMRPYEDLGTAVHVEPGSSGTVSLRLIQGN